MNAPFRNKATAFASVPGEVLLLTEQLMVLCEKHGLSIFDAVIAHRMSDRGVATLENDDDDEDELETRTWRLSDEVPTTSPESPELTEKEPRSYQLSLSEEAIFYGQLVVDPPCHRIYLEGLEVKFTPSEFSLLQMLVSHPGRVFTRSHIIREIKSLHSTASERTVDAHVRALRSKLGYHRDLIETVRGLGYRARVL